jgi:hypothetical protein
MPRLRLAITLRHVFLESPVMALRDQLPRRADLIAEIDRPPFIAEDDARDRKRSPTHCGFDEGKL